MDDAVVRINYDNGAFHELAFDEFVKTIQDHGLILDRTLLIRNAEHPCEEAVIANLCRIMHAKTGLPVVVIQTNANHLGALDLNIDEHAFLWFMAGRPLWVQPTFFTTISPGKRHRSKTTSRLDRMLVSTATLGEVAVAHALKRSYQCGPRRGPRQPENAKRHAQTILSGALGARIDSNTYDSDGNIMPQLVDPILRDFGEADDRQVDACIGPVHSASYDSARYRPGVAADLTQKQLSDFYKKMPEANKWPPAGSHSDANWSVRNNTTLKSNVYVDCIKTIALEIERFEELFGNTLDGEALAAWNERIVKTIRMAASASGTLDKQRQSLALKLRKLYRSYLKWRAKGRYPKAERILGRITQDVIDFNHKRHELLRVVDPEKHNDLSAGSRDGIYRVFTPLNATILAFYAGVDPRIINRDICRDVEVAVAPILDIALWTGRLKRERIRDLTPDIADAFSRVMFEVGWTDENKVLFKNCFDLALSCFNERSRRTLITAAKDTHETGRCWTGTFARLVKLTDDIPPQEAAGIFDALPQNCRYNFDHDVGCWRNSYRLLSLEGTLTAIPPAYATDWLNRRKLRFDDDGNLSGWETSGK